MPVRSIYLRSVLVQRNYQRRLKEKMAKKGSCNDFAASVGVNQLKSFNREFTSCIWLRKPSNCSGVFVGSSGKSQANARSQANCKVRFNLSNRRQQITKTTEIISLKAIHEFISCRQFQQLTNLLKTKWKGEHDPQRSFSTSSKKEVFVLPHYRF